MHVYEKPVPLRRDGVHCPRILGDKEWLQGDSLQSGGTNSVVSTGWESLSIKGGAEVFLRYSIQVRPLPHAG